MPIYEYQCTSKCPPFERIRSVNVCHEPAVCPCGRPADKVLTVPASIRMGTGTTRRDSGMNRSEV